MALSRLLTAAGVLALALTAGCVEPEALEDLDPSELDERFACDDLTVVAASRDAHSALLVGIDDGLVAATLATGQPTEELYELPDERLTVRWVSGSNVYQGHCGRDSGEPWALDERSDAVTGQMHVRVVPGPGKSVRLEAELRDVILAETEYAEGDEPELFIHFAQLSDIIID